MGITLGENQYGKAENRVVRIYRDAPRHEIRDVNVSTSLRGDFTAAHLHGDQGLVLPTDTQKNTCYAYAKEKGLGSIEDYGLRSTSGNGRWWVASSTTTPGSARARRCARRPSPSTARASTRCST
jgi:Uricase